MIFKTASSVILLFITTSLLVNCNASGLHTLELRPDSVFDGMKEGNKNAPKRLRKALQGVWICSKIVDQGMQDSYGKFGVSGSFLKFEFKGNRLYIATAPYDDGMEFVVTYSRKDSMIYLPLPYSAPEIEPDYKVSKLADNLIILDATNSDLNRIHYIFLRQRQYTDPDKVPEVIDCGSVILQQILLKHPGGTEHPNDSEYHISVDAPLFYPVPEFRTQHTSTFGYMMTWDLDFPDSFAVDSLSNEMILEFAVSRNGAEDIKIIQGIDQVTDQLIVDTFRNTRRKWQPIKIGRNKVPMRLRMHIYLNKKRLEI